MRTSLSFSTPDRRRTALLGALLTAALLAAPRHLAAQPAQAASPAPPGAVRAFVGAYVPTGDHRDLLKDAVTVGAAVSYDLNAYFGVTGSLSWAPTADRTLRDETVDLWQYDVGVEAGPRAASVGRWVAKPFAGLGLGGRTYSYRDVDDADAQTVFDGYGALGVDAAYRRFGLRVEARDYVSDFKGLRGDRERSTRNDVTVVAAAAVRF